MASVSLLSLKYIKTVAIHSMIVNRVTYVQMHRISWQAPYIRLLRCCLIVCHDYESIHGVVNSSSVEENKEGIILYIKFKNYDRFIRVSFVIHANFESFRLTHASWGRRRASLISIKSTNHVGSAAITSFASIHSFTSFIHKSQSSTEQRVRMKMLLKYLLKCLKEHEEYK